MSASLSRREVAAARRRRLFFEPLEERSLLAAVITVNSTLDTDSRDSALTLREAILINNRTLGVGSLTAAELAQVVGTPTNSDRDTIGFNIAGSGVRTISPSPALPAITESVVIDGYTQPGTSRNTDPNGFNGVLLIELRAPSGTNSDGLLLEASNSTIRGLVINAAGRAGVRILSIGSLNASNNVIEGNFLGTDATGTSAVPNNRGIEITATSTATARSSNNVIGGSSPAARNVISGNQSGVFVSGLAAGNGTSQNTIIRGNFIGTNASGTFALGNFVGVESQFFSTGTIIGGSNVGEGNLISGNKGEGVGLSGFQTNCTGSAVTVDSGSGMIIRGNKIGTDVSGTLPLGNGGNGITIGLQSPSTNLVGGTGAGEGNIIAFNGLNGVSILNSQTAILSNSIFSNGQLGINLGPGCAVTPNDAGDPDSGPNNLQNFPEISAASASGGNLTVNYAVPSTTAHSVYPLRVEFFKADSAGQEGQVFVGAGMYLASEANTTKVFSFGTSVAFSSNDKLVATATDGNGNTSEFSAPITVEQSGCSLIVTNTLDSGPGSLRAAITCANTNAVDDVILVPAGEYTLTGAANEGGNVGGDLDLIEANRSLTIRGAGASQTIINAGGNDRGVDVLQNVTAVLESLSIIGGSATSGGGILNAGNLTLNDVTVRNNTATTGGGVHNTGQLTLDRTTVRNNLATSTSNSSPRGGGISSLLGAVANPFVMIVDSTIEDNTVILSGSPTTSVFAEGGAVSSEFAAVTVLRSVIRNNSVASSATTTSSAHAHGGGVAVRSAAVKITSSEIRNNRVTNSGGGSEFGFANGGGIYVVSGSLTIESQSSVVDNTALNDSSTTTNLINVLGGGIFFGGNVTGSALSISDTEVSRNSAEVTSITASSSVAGGGGVQAVNGTMQLARTTIDANRVTGMRTGFGGGLQIGSSSDATTATLTNVIISANVVAAPLRSWGGGLVTSSNVTVNILESAIRGNQITGPGRGGGMLFRGNQLTIVGSTVSENSINSIQSGSGGGIETEGPLTMINSTVSGNAVTGADGFIGTGGGISTLNEVVLIRNSTITGNRVIQGTIGGLDATLDAGGTPSVAIHNSIVGGNFAGPAGTTPSDIGGTINVGTAQSPSSFNNLVGDSATSGGLMNGVNGNKVGNNGSGTININTVLNTVLANNGGPTMAHSLVAGSPAINSGSNTQAVDAQNQPLTTDQRSAGFPRIINNVVDIGPFEAVQQVCSLVVVNSLDSGPGSLREAINCANSTPNVDGPDVGSEPDPDVITFAIPGAGVKSIAPLSALPAITEAVIVDGYSQPGASRNTKGPGLGGDAVLLVELNGANAGASATGLQLSGANDSIVKGLVINRFADGGIRISNGNRNAIEGNYIGTNPAGTMALANKNFGVTVSASTISGPSADNLIGGTSAAARNLISGNQSFVAGSFYPGILLVGSASGNHFITDTSIQGNFIGTDVTGKLALPNSMGISVSSQTSDTIIGGPAAGEGNLVSGNQFDGIGLGARQIDCMGGSGSAFDSVGNVIQGNRIGTDVAGLQPLGNGSNGIVVGFQPGSSHTIGGTGPGEGNIIGFNGLNGVSLFNSHTAVLSNSFFSNSLLGINLNFACSVTENDPGDADGGPNNQQNFPELATASYDGGNLTVDYAVPSSTDFSAYPLRVEFFKADSAGEEGRVFVGADTYLAANASATKSIAFVPAVGFSLGNKLVATATDSNGNTSEFSTGFAVEAPSCFVVTHMLDSGLGSLREAINCANSTPNEDGPDPGFDPDPDVITFAIPGTGVKTIAPASPLPAITEAVVIDGYSQPGASANSLAVGNNAVLMVELSGVSAGAVASGLTITGSGSTVKGLVINRFAANGVLLQTGGFNTIAGNFIGTNAAGNAALSNGSTGVRVFNSGNNTIGGSATGARNVISGNLDSGVYVIGPTSGGNTIAGNYVGVSANGAAALGNSLDGVVVQSPNATIGGNQAGAGNVISGNARAGLVLFSGALENVVEGNLIGVNAAGTAALGNQAEGIGIHQSAIGNLIGGPGAGAGNVVSGNVQDGIVLFSGAELNTISGNRIGTDRGGTLAIANGTNGIRVAGGNRNTIGDGNTIVHNGASGIVVIGSAAVRNTIRGNSIHDNAGLGIDLAGDGVTSNDLGDGDTGPNGLQNFPVITGVAATGGNTIISGRLESTPNTPFRLEFFASDLEPAGFGEGQVILGTIDVTTNATGRVFFTTPGFAGVVPAGRVVTATATTRIDDDGNPSTPLALADTSEFSAAICSLIVTTTADSGLGSLREAITCANIVSNVDRDGLAGVDPDPITFAIPGSGVRTITLASPLPTITEAVTIDGYSQPGASVNTQAEGNDAVLLVEINAAAAGASTGVLHITGGSSTVRGLVINRSPGAAIVVPPATGASNRIDGNFLGTNAAGDEALPNGGGIFVATPSNVIGGELPRERNVIVTTGDAVRISSGQVQALGVLVRGNYLGTNAAGTAALPVGSMGTNGVLIAGAANNTIGGTSTGARNVIANFGVGVSIFGSAASVNTVQGNYIGTDAAGVADLANGLGIQISQVAGQAHNSGNMIGGAMAGAGNVVSGNGAGIVVHSDFNTVQGNLIGVDFGGVSPLANGGAGIVIDQDAVSNSIGGTANGAANTIAYNATGIVVASGEGNSFLTNSIHSNLGLGIDLVSSVAGVTANDAGDSDEGPNRLQNFPQIASAAPGEFGGITITYFVPSEEAYATYPLRIEFFKADASGQEGREFLGVDTFTLDDFAAGPKTILLSPNANVELGDRLVATATDSTAAESPNNTSEFSIAVVVDDGICDFVVTNANDSGPGSLRDAITCANGIANVDVDGLPGAEADVITFAIPANDPRHFYYVNDGVAGQVSRGSVTATTAVTDAGLVNADPDWPHSWFSIDVGSVLPEITEGVVIDGYTQPGANGNTLAVGNDAVLKVEVSGRADMTPGAGGFFVEGGDSTIRGLIVNRFANPDVAGISGIVLSSDFNFVEGNFIGTDASGTIDLGNSLHGVVVATGANNHVGGTARSARNVISGSGSGENVLGGGVVIGNADDQDPGPIGTRVLGNYIGTNADGTAALPNAGGGVEVVEGLNSLIGGDDDDDGLADGIVASRNVISGNQGPGVWVVPNGTTVFDVAIQGSFLGVDAAGTAALANSDGVIVSGAALSDNDVTIGGVTPGAGNVLSGNLLYGLWVVNVQTLNVQGNLVGTDASGTQDLGNGLTGILVDLRPDLLLEHAVTIGGTEPGARNVVSGNDGDFGGGIGIEARGQMTGTLDIQRNLIGTQIDGVTPLPNAGHGIVLSRPAILGGVNPGNGNVIAHNGGSGVVVNESAEPGASGVTILGNSIFANGGLGIDLGDDGVTVNDLMPTPDFDGGPNNRQNFPVITAATVSGGEVTITYSVPSAVGNSTYPIFVEFFLADAAGEEGQTFVGSDIYTADDLLAGSKTIVLTLLSPVAAGDEVVATATDSAPVRAGFIGPLAVNAGEPNNTSEFSPSTTVLLPIPPQADLSVTKTDGVATAVPGNGLTYTIVVSNAGPAVTSGAILSDVFPAAFTNVTYASAAAGGASGNTVSGSGNIFDNLSLPAGASVTYTVTGFVSPSATGSLSNTASVTTPDGITDTNPANNSATDTDALSPRADLSITKSDGVASVAAGATLTYTIVVSNAGPSAVTGATVTDLFPAVFLSPVFTAAGSGGAAGFSSGNGNIQQSLSLPVNSSITYIVTGTVSASASGTLSNSATVSVPAGVSDPNLANGSAVDADNIIGVGPAVGLVIGADAHSRGKPMVSVYDNQGVRIRKFLAYANSYRGGVRVALGDVTGDGLPEIVTAPGGNHSPLIKVFTLEGVELPQFRFLAYAGNFSGGVYVAVGDVVGDALNDIVVSPAREGRGVNGPRNGGTEVRVYENRLGINPGDPFLDNAPDRKFLAFPKNVVNVNFLGGGTVATGDVQPGGKLEVIVGSGPGMRATARVFNVEQVNPVVVGSWLPFDRNVRGGIFVSAGRIDGDAAADVVFGAWQGSDGLVEVRSGASGALLRPLFKPYVGLPRRVGSASGLRVVARDVNGDGTVDRIIAGQGSDGRTKKIVQFAPLDSASADFLLENDADFIGGFHLG